MLSNYASLAILLALIAIVYILDRKNFKKEGPLFYLRRTEKGLKFIETFSAKHTRFFKIFADLGIIFSFGALGGWYIFKTKKSKNILLKTLISFGLFYALFNNLLKIMFPEIIAFFGASGMIVALLLQSAFDLIVAPTAVAAVQLVLPVSIPNAPVFYVPMDFWLISIFIILVAHELSHALVAKAQGINVKSLGYGFLAILPLGFAEPDEKQIKKSSSLVKTRIYGAGSFANFIVALLAIPLLLGVMFAYPHYVDVTGISYTETLENTSAYDILPANGTITMIAGNQTKDLYNLSIVMDSLSPGDTIPEIVNNQEYTITLSEHPENASRAFMGISSIEQETVNTVPGTLGTIIVAILIYSAKLLNFIFGLNLGIGLANLLPIKPLDGGLMFEEILKTAGIKRWKNVVKYISLATLLLLLFNLLGPGFL